MSEMIQLNLVPDIKKEYLKSQRTKRLIMLVTIGTTGFFVAIVFLLAVTVFIMQRRHMSNLSGDISSKIGQLREIQDLDKVLTVQNQLIAMPDLHTKKPVASRTFDYLGRITPSDIELDTFSITYNSSGETSSPDSSSESEFKTEMSINGRAKNFKSVNRFVDTLKNAKYSIGRKQSGQTLEKHDAFVGVVLESISKTEDNESNLKTQFTVNLKFDPDMFSYNNPVVNIYVPSIVSSVSEKERPRVFGGEINGR